MFSPKENSCTTGKFFMTSWTNNYKTLFFFCTKQNPVTEIFDLHKTSVECHLATGNQFFSKSETTVWWVYLSLVTFSFYHLAHSCFLHDVGNNNINSNSTSQLCLTLIVLGRHTISQSYSSYDVTVELTVEHPWRQSLTVPSLWGLSRTQIREERLSHYAVQRGLHPFVELHYNMILHLLVADW